MHKSGCDCDRDMQLVVYRAAPWYRVSTSRNDPFNATLPRPDLARKLPTSLFSLIDCRVPCGFLCAADIF